MTQRKAFLFGFFSIVLGLVVSVLLLELGATAYLTLHDHKFIPAHQRFEDASHPWFEGTIARPTDTYYCKHLYTLFPHPYLGWVYHGNPPCGYPKSINNIGLHRHDFPAERINDRYVVLLTGGSVAEYVGGGNQQFVGGGLHPPYLERALNAHWIGPNGKPFLVLQGAAGGWKQPQAAIMFMLYADLVDAVVTLDGGNEFARARSADGERFEYPFLHFQEVNPLATDSFSTVVAQWALSNTVTAIRTTAPFSYSSLAFILAERLDALAEPDPKRTSSWRTTVQSIFAAPKGWSQDYYLKNGIQQYEKYVREMHSIAREFGDRDAYFVQPISALDKVLTPEERASAGSGDYGEKYLVLNASMLALNKKGIPVFSIIDVFKNEKQRIYADGVHSMWDDKTQESYGYTLMADRMAKDLAVAWHVKPKPGQVAARPENGR